MLRNKTIAVLFAAAAVLVAAVPAQAAIELTNTGNVNYTNESGVVQPVSIGSTVFTVEGNPTLSVVKTRDIGSGPSGTLVTFQIKVTYPRVADALLRCGDDSDATNVVVTDAVPAGMTYATGTMRVSNDNGGTWTVLTDAADVDAGSFAAGTVTVNVGTLIEGDGDQAACSSGATARIVEFGATAN